MFIYISIFIAVLLCLIIFGYIFLPNSQFTLTFTRRYFILTVIFLSAVFLYFLGFGIYDLTRSHQEIKIVEVDDESHIVDGITGNVMLLEDKKVHAGEGYKTVIFTWKRLNDNAKIFMESDKGEAFTVTDSINITPLKDPLYNQMKLSLEAKYMYEASLLFPSPGTWKVSFGDKSDPKGTLKIEVFK